MTRIIIVDKNDNIIGSEEREVVDEKNLRYRVSGLWIKNSKGDFLLARRAYTKSHYPGKWGPAAAGTVEEGETYEENIIKEAEEELGIKNIEICELKKIKVEGEYNYFTQGFISVIDKSVEEFKIQEDEVAEIKWFSKDELLDGLKNNSKEFIPRMKEYFGMLC